MKRWYTIMYYNSCNKRKKRAIYFPFRKSQAENGSVYSYKQPFIKFLIKNFLVDKSPIRNQWMRGLFVPFISFSLTF